MRGKKSSDSADERLDIFKIQPMRGEKVFRLSQEEVRNS